MHLTLHLISKASEKVVLYLKVIIATPSNQFVCVCVCVCVFVCLCVCLCVCVCVCVCAVLKYSTIHMVLLLTHYETSSAHIKLCTNVYTNVSKLSIISLQIDDSASESFLGVIVAGYSLGSVLAAPLFGVWSNYRSVSEPLIFSLTLYCGGNLLYVYAESFSGIEKWILFISRFIVGSGSGYHKFY